MRIWIRLHRQKNLNDAIRCRDLSRAEELLQEFHANPNKATGIHEYPLVLGIISDSLNLVELLVRSGAKVDNCQPEVVAALIALENRESERNFEAIAQLVLGNGGLDSQWDEGSPILEAVKSNSIRLARFLLEFGGPIESFRLNGVHHYLKDGKHKDTFV